MSEQATLPLTASELYERIASAVREALPGDAGELLLARIVSELAAADQESGRATDAELDLELERQAATDSLTGLPNRLRFTEDLTRAIAASTRYDEPLSLLVLDLGGREADERAAGEALLRLVRITDVVARIAPRRFAIILPRTGTIGCALVEARMLAIEQHAFTVGSATTEGMRADVVDLLARAEESLAGQAS